MSPTRRVSPTFRLIAICAAVLIAAGTATLATGATDISAPSAGGPVVADSISSTSTTSATQTSTTTTTSLTYSETSSLVAYHGTWSSASYSKYIGGRIKWSRQRGAYAVFTFTGTAVSWVGPIGPTRGQAKVYIDGKYIRTVSMYSPMFSARHTIFSATYAAQRARTLKIVVLGTAGHPIVGIDALVVRRITTTEAARPAPTPSPTPAPSGAPTPAPTPAPTHAPTPAPTPAPTAAPGTVSVTVTSISALKSALANNSVDQIVVANGTYHVSPSTLVRSDSLWIGGGAITSRTRPVLVRAQTRGGVTFDGGGGGTYAGLSFEDGAHDQTWDGFVFANMRAEQSGIIEFGGYVPRRTPHHITLRNITIARTCVGRATSATAPTLDHAIYVSNAASVGPNHLLMEDITVDGRGGLASAVHFDHGDATNPNATNVVVRRLHVLATQQAILFWTPTVKTVTFDDVDITNALYHAIRFESIGASGVVLSNITSTGTGTQPFYSSMGSTPPGVTFINTSLH